MAETGVALREVDAENVRALCELMQGEGQEVYVAPAAYTVAEAAYEPDGMLRAIYRPDGDRPLGVLFVDLGSAHGTDGSPFLARLLIDASHQRRGLGGAAMRALFAELSAAGHAELATSYHPGPGEPRDFYLGLGFEPTGEICGDEVMMRRELPGPDHGSSSFSKASSASSR